MVYHIIGLMSGSSLDGLDIAYVTLHEAGSKWTFEVTHAECVPYTSAWTKSLAEAHSLLAIDYQLLHTKYGHYIGEIVKEFINKYNLHHKIHLIASHGHTVFHKPAEKMTAQIGDGAAIAATTGLPVVSDLRAMDIALGGQGAPVVPIGEKLLFPGYDYYLNIGGIANISGHNAGEFLAFDVCPANRVLNMLAKESGKEYDTGGEMAATGIVNEALLQYLNNLEYYSHIYPKSLSNDFGTGIVYPMIKESSIQTIDALATYVEHVAQQVKNAVGEIQKKIPVSGDTSMFVSGGGAMNNYLMQRIRHYLDTLHVKVIVPNPITIEYKEAIIMALMSALRWREEENVMASVTGASRNSIGGALWLG